MDENDTAATEQPTMAAMTAARMQTLNAFRSSWRSIFSPAERMR